MFLDFLPKKILNLLKDLSLNSLYEIRLRLNKNIIIFYQGRYVLLEELCGKKIICEINDIDYIIKTITENSIYAFNEQIKKGYLTTKDGIRVGLCGKVIIIDRQVKTITQFSSLNIRIPHNILGCSDEIYNKLMLDGKLKSLLICSKPFMGKTTIIKDLALKLNNFYKKQILIIDERNEFSLVDGDYIDKIVDSNKEYAFNIAVRSMSPEVIICDELACKDDWHYVKKASLVGIKVIATCHLDNLDKLKSNMNFVKDIFDYYIFLEESNIKGKIKNIYDSKFNEVK